MPIDFSKFQKKQQEIPQKIIKSPPKKTDKQIIEEPIQKKYGGEVDYDRIVKIIKMEFEKAFKKKEKPITTKVSTQISKKSKSTPHKKKEVVKKPIHKKKNRIERIKEYMEKKGEPVTSKELAEELGSTNNSISVLLSNRLGIDFERVGYGKYVKWC